MSMNKTDEPVEEYAHRVIERAGHLPWPCVRGCANVVHLLGTAPRPSRYSCRCLIKVSGGTPDREPMSQSMRSFSSSSRI